MIKLSMPMKGNISINRDKSQASALSKLKYTPWHMKTSTPGGLAECLINHPNPAMQHVHLYNLEI